MAFVLNALIAELELLRAEPELVVVPMPQGQGLVPLTEEFWRRHGHHSLPLLRAAESRLALDDDFEGPEERQATIDRAVASFTWIAGVCARLAARPGAVVAYVEADFFGGEGGQAAEVWEAGQPVLGPVVEQAAINLALARIGVQRSGGDDEFTALLLGRCRRTSRWLTLA